MARVRVDAGDDGVAPPDRGSGFEGSASHATGGMTLAQQQQRQALAANRAGRLANTGASGEIGVHEDPELVELERRLNDEVDEDFFEEPRTFNTLQRVIDVLGLQMIDDATLNQKTQDLLNNPAYRNLKSQQQIVEGAIEHMAVIHCSDLNGSVIQVGKVARQFTEAVNKVRTLRKQVRDIQDTLGANHAANESQQQSSKKTNVSPPQQQQQQSNAAAMSLRELWLKKLECEATLSLLSKIDIIRAAPSKFDAFLLRPPCRIGAAILTLTEALSNMFSDDVAQVQALHKIMEQLMLRKQRAEEVLWDTLHEVIFLRTGNGVVSNPVKAGSNPVAALPMDASNNKSAGSSVGGESKGTLPKATAAKASSLGVSSHYDSVGMVNPFMNKHQRRLFAMDEDFENDNISLDSAGSGASLFSLEADHEEDEVGSPPAVSSASVAASRKSGPAEISIPRAPIRRTMMIPIPMVEAELDLEADERRCLEEVALSGMANVATTGLRQRNLPRYADPILALRILVECLAQLKRLDDCDRVLGEGLEREIRRIVQREQARTFARLEKMARNQNIRGGALVGSSILGVVAPQKSTHKQETLKEFRRHLIGLLSAFGCVMMRLSHLAEILRVRIGSDKELIQTIENPSTVMASVLDSAHEIMQREIKAFLKACLVQTEHSRSDPMDSAGDKGSIQYESGLFSLGIVEQNARSGQKAVSATRTNVMEMSTSKFVSNVLFPKTKKQPQIRYALIFRRSVARWTAEMDQLKRELGLLTGLDTSAAAYVPREKSAIAFLDGVINDQLLPVLQEEAVNGTVMGLERNDAFSPNLDRTLYARPNSNEPQDVDMCTACQAIYNSTGPLFLALHRLPSGGEMYLPLVAVLEHVMLIFISRVKQQMEKICSVKTAYKLLTESTDEMMTLPVLIERRRPFQKLMAAYGTGTEGQDTTAAPSSPSGKPSNLFPLSPPAGDTSPRKIDLKLEMTMEEIGEGVDGEERLLEEELKFLESYLDFGAGDKHLAVCTDDELMKSACLAHSLLKLAGLLGARLKLRDGLSNKNLASTRALQEAIKSIRLSGILMVKFCRMDMLMQTINRLSKVPISSTIVARDAVRIPSSVNDLGEYLTGASDNLREAAGNAVTAYTFSSLEQYIPYGLCQVVRAIAAGKGIVKRAPLTMNGIEALDRSGSVLYRDLKGATSFDNSFWDVELAAVSFERSASFMAMMELEMDELVVYYNANQHDFPEQDFLLMFGMTGPRRRGDVNQFHMMKRRMK